jgi:GNAT superfamily N-acetyltransferase
MDLSPVQLAKLYRIGGGSAILCAEDLAKVGVMNEGRGQGAGDLRRAGPADAAAIAELTDLAYAKWVPVIGRKPKPMTADYHIAVLDHLIDLLYIGRDLAALIEMIPQPDHLLIENLAVSPAFQGGGHGRRLVAHAERLAASQGLAEVKLYTNKLFAANIAFYQRLGYRLEREEAFKGGFIVHLHKLLR